MRGAIARWLVLTYPRAWRARYEDEFMAMLEDGMTWRNAPDVIGGALDAWLVPLRSAIQGPHGVEAKAIVAYVALQLIVFAVLRLLAGPGRIDVGIGWGMAYGVGYAALCRVLKARRERRDGAA
jgi:hypothetical protein